jgi:hypothetical protein
MGACLSSVAETITVDDPSGIDNAIAAALEKAGDDRLVIIFVHGDAPGGVYWCDDTIAQKPIVDKMLPAAKKKLVVVDCPVSQAAWKDTKNLHPYRTHPQMALKGSPTLLKWGKSGPVERLTEAQITEAAVNRMTSWAGTL